MESKVDISSLPKLTINTDPLPETSKRRISSVRVALMPGQIRTIQIETPTTVACVLNDAGLEVPPGYQIRVSKQIANLSSVVADGQDVLLIRPVKGNGGLIAIRVALMPGLIKTVQVEAPATVSSALQAAGLQVPPGYQIRVSKQIANLSTPVLEGQDVLLIRPVKGNG